MQFSTVGTEWINFSANVTTVYERDSDILHCYRKGLNLRNNNCLHLKNGSSYCIWLENEDEF